MHDAKAIVSAPCSISIFARNMDFLPGHPPQVMNPIYNPQIQISAESGTKRSNFRQKDKTKRSKKGCTQHL